MVTNDYRGLPKGSVRPVPEKPLFYFPEWEPQTNSLWIAKSARIGTLRHPVYFDPFPQGVSLASIRKSSCNSIGPLDISIARVTDIGWPIWPDIMSVYLPEGSSLKINLPR
jgi:hypothetical protein